MAVSASRRVLQCEVANVSCTRMHPFWGWCAEVPLRSVGLENALIPRLRSALKQSQGAGSGPAGPAARGPFGYSSLSMALCACIEGRIPIGMWPGPFFGEYRSATSGGPLPRATPAPISNTPRPPLGGLNIPEYSEDGPERDRPNAGQFGWRFRPPLPMGRPGGDIIGCPA